MKDYYHKINAFYKLNGFLVNLLILLVALVISLYLVNRAFIIGCLIAILFLFLVYNKVKLSKKVIAIITLSSLILITSLAFFVKSDSTLGRIFIYKVSWTMFTDHFLIGMGFGKFQVNYNLYQSTYFSNGNFTEKEFLLADSVFFAFNDYWQFIIEFGLIGFVMMIGVFIFIFKMIRRTLRTHSTSHLSKLIAALLIMVLIAALFTHVFEKKIFQLFTIISITWLVFINSNQKIKFAYRRSLFMVFVLGLLVLEYANDMIYLHEYKEFEKAKLLSVAGYRLESQKIYGQIYPKLKNDVGFLVFYCDEFFDYKDPNSSLNDYLLLAEKRTEYRVYLKLASVYQNLKRNREAEEMYLKALHMVPNRFSSRLELFNFYLSIKNLMKAKKLGWVTLKMPVKIPSKRVFSIKKEIREKINEINSYR